MSRLKTINPEKIAYWFFRLNGCLTIENFVVHPDYRSPSQRTDVDILGVRFPYRAELLTSGNPMKDHMCFSTQNRIDVILAEVKHAVCRLNGPWTNPPDENMFRVLYSIGVFKQEQVPPVAQALYTQGIYLDNQYRVRLFALGSRKNPDLFPSVIQFDWDEVLSFMYTRFNSYHDQKAHHGQWDFIGKHLFRYSTSMTLESYMETIKDEMMNYVHN